MKGKMLFCASGVIFAGVLSGLLAWKISLKQAEAALLQNAEHEASILLELTNSYVSTYGQMRQSVTIDQLPVPASFRADAIAHFERRKQTASPISTSMVGLPGREIATPPVDSLMVAQLQTMMRSPDIKPSSMLFVKEGNKVYRTLFPSVASSRSCAICHNRIQQKSPQDSWQQGDLMGAYVVDRVLNKPLSDIMRISALIAALCTFLTIAAILLTMYAVNQRKLARQLALLASTDPLTGCINRREMYKRVQRQKSPVTGALLLTDLDDFKAINDTYGHAAGDLVLSDFAAGVRQSIRVEDWIARVGGEEFVIWLPNVDSINAKKIGERIRTRTEKTIVAFGEEEIRYTVSVGLQLVHADQSDHFENWLKSADELLYRAKKEGRNRIVEGSILPA